MKLKVATDCSGIDAPIVALKRIGWPIEQVFCSDIYQPALEVLAANKADSCVIFNDITERSPKSLSAFRNLDLYVFSPPCKNYSALTWNKNKEDPHLWQTCIDVVEYSKPKVCVFENVERFKTANKSKHFSGMLKRINDIGCYEVHHSVLTAKITVYLRTENDCLSLAYAKIASSNHFNGPRK